MNRYPDLELALRADFRERADPSSTDAQFDAILDRAVATRQRPAWLAGLRNRSASASLPVGRTGRSRGALALVAVAMAGALLVAMAFLGGPQPQLVVPRDTASPAVSAVPVVRGPRPNGKIFFSRVETVFTIDPDGSNRRQITASWGEGAVLASDRLHIVSPRGMFDFDGGDITVFGYPRYPLNMIVIDVAPDGSRYLSVGYPVPTDSAIGASAGRVAVIYTVRAPDMGDARPLVEFPQGVPGPARLSPDGTTVAYIKPDAGNANQLRLIGTDATGDRAVGSIRNPTSLDWAPDGQSLLVTSIAGLFIVDIRTGAETLVVTAVGGRPVEAAVWSPDGTRILVLERVGSLHQYDLVTMDVHGGDQLNVTNNPSNIWSIGWGVHPLG